MAEKRAEDGLYEVEKIVGDKVVNGIIHYNIQWKGYGEQDNTWEPVNCLVGCQSLIKEYRDGKASLSPQKRTSPRKQTTLPSEDGPLTPRRQSRSLTKRITGGTTPVSPSSTYWLRSPGEYSPSRYHFRKSTVNQRNAVPSYLTTEEGGPLKSPLGHGFERRDLHMCSRTVTWHSQTSNDRSLPSSGDEAEGTALEQPEEQQHDHNDKTPSWMQLGYAELFFCLILLFMISLAIWYLSTTKFNNLS